MSISFSSSRPSSRPSFGLFEVPRSNPMDIPIHCRRQSMGLFKAQCELIQQYNRNLATVEIEPFSIMDLHNRTEVEEEESLYIIDESESEEEQDEYEIQNRELAGTSKDVTDEEDFAFTVISSYSARNVETTESSAISSYSHNELGMVGNNI